LLVAVGLFAPLFGLLNAFEVPPLGYAFCALFCVAIPLGQVSLYQGRKPRLASCLVGTRLLPLLVVGGFVLVAAPDFIADFRRGGTFDILAWAVLLLLFMFVFMAGLGYALGYSIGTVTAGVFLVVDRKWNAGRRGDASGSDVDSEQTTTATDSDVPATGKWWLDWIAWSPMQWFWKRRNRPVRNALVLTFLAAVPFAIGMPIAVSGGFLKQYLIGTSIASPLIGLVLAGLLLVHWRVTLTFCALGIPGVIYPLSQIKELWVPRWIIDTVEISFPALAFYSGVAMGLFAAGLFGWVRWMLPERAKSHGGWRLGLLVGAGLGVVLVLFGVGARHIADSPRERVLRQIYSRGGIDQRSPFSVSYIYCDSQDLADGTLKNIDAIWELQNLDLGDCKISREEMQAVGRLANLQCLSLIDCRIAKDSCQELRSLGRLARLNLYGSNVSDGDLKFLGHLPALTLLDVSATEIDGSGLRHLAKLKSLTRLDLSGTSISDDDLEHLAGAKGLVTLTLNGTKITGTGLRHLRNLKNLTYLDLRDVQLDDEGLAHLPPLPALASLSLCGTKVTGDGLRHIKKLPTLYWLDLSECDIDDADLKQLRGFPLGRLVVERTGVSNQAKSDLESLWQSQQPIDVGTGVLDAESQVDQETTTDGG